MWGKLFGRKQRAPADDPRNPYLDMRGMALAVSADRVGIDPSAGEAVLGVIADWNTGRWTASVVCLADGTTSMYLSTGGGFIGAGEREEVREANRRVIDLAIASFKLMDLTEDHPLPPENCTRFAVITTSGAYAAVGRNDDLARSQHPLAPLAGAVQEVITYIRLANEQRQ